MKKTNIMLIGFMGSGKTTVGKLLSKKMDRYFLDIDEIIEFFSGLPIYKIFEIYSEKHFRNLEKKACNELSSLQNCVIATGGGTCINIENIEMLKKISTVIYLKKSLQITQKHIKNDTKRPLFSTNTKDMFKLFEKRQYFYEKYTDITINTDEKAVDSIVNEIIYILEQVKK